MNFDLAQQLLVDGLVDGSFIAIVAVSWSIIYSTTRVFHFAHALAFVLTGYAATIVAGDWGLPRGLALLGAMLVAGVFGMLTERLLYRRLRRSGASGFSMFLASMGVFIVGLNLLSIFLSTRPRSLGRFPTTAYDVGAWRITLVDFVMVVVAWTLVVLVISLEHRSRWGRAVVAARANPVMARSVGVDLDRVYLLAFAAGSLVLAVAAFYYTAKNSAQPSMGVEPIIAGLVAMFLGGIGRTAGAALGAVVLGVSQNLGGLWLPGHWQVIVSFLILFFVLLLRPQGLLAAPS